MKKSFVLFLFCFYLNLQATHSLCYCIYVETECYQGSWKRLSSIENTDYLFLNPLFFQESFGSHTEELLKAKLKKLKLNSTANYDWKYDLEVIEDKVIIAPKSEIDNRLQIQNEITASFVFNRFKEVEFLYPGESVIWTVDSLTLPYMDLIDSNKIEKKAAEKIKADSDIKAKMKKNVLDKDDPQKQAPSKSEEHRPKGSGNFALLGSALLNVLLLGLLIFKNRK